MVWLVSAMFYKYSCKPLTLVVISVTPASYKHLLNLLVTATIKIVKHIYSQLAFQAYSITPKQTVLITTAIKYMRLHNIVNFLPFCCPAYFLGCCAPFCSLTTCSTIILLAPFTEIIDTFCGKKTTTTPFTILLYFLSFQFSFQIRMDFPFYMVL